MSNETSSRLTGLMEETVAFSMNHVQNGGIPFSAFVVDRNGMVLGRGVNRVREHSDPTAHAEVDAIRNACRMNSITNLTGATLLASGEPCAMCYMNALYAGIAQIFFAADRDEAASNGFDYRRGYELFGIDPTHWSSPQARKLTVPDSLLPFHAFQKRGAT